MIARPGTGCTLRVGRTKGLQATAAMEAFGEIVAPRLGGRSLAAAFGHETI
ncbi:MAG TPA: hypothetical protein VN444_05450 [Verrucomicrobiae bacterium]|nr:hypothetical protein [Verrucomicrobiae bacterium]